MDVNATALATTIVASFLLPYVKIGLSSIRETLNDKVGELVAKKSSELTESVWAKISELFTNERDQATLKDFQESPDETKSLLEKKLAAKLSENTKIAQELELLINQQFEDSNLTGAQIMQAHTAGILDMRNSNLSNISGSTFAGVIVNKSSSTD